MLVVASASCEMACNRLRLSIRLNLSIRGRRRTCHGFLRQDRVRLSAAFKSVDKAEIAAAGLKRPLQTIPCRRQIVSDRTGEQLLHASSSDGRLVSCRGLCQTSLCGRDLLLPAHSVGDHFAFSSGDIISPQIGPYRPTESPAQSEKCHPCDFSSH